MSHSLKIWENILNKRVKNQIRVFITKYQFGFMTRRFIMEPIFFIRQIVQKYREITVVQLRITVKIQLYMVFIYLEKACQRAPREILKQALLKKGLKNVIKDMYKRASTIGK